MRVDPLRGLPREVGVLTAVSFTVALGFGIVAPALPVFATGFGVGEAAAAAVISAFAFMRFVSALGSGWLVDRAGERTLLAAGIGVVAVSSALAGLSQSYLQLIVLRGIGGVGSALFSVSALSLLLRTVGAELRGRATGAYQGGFVLGGIAGPALGGLLAAISIRAPFFVYAAVLAVAGAIAMHFLSRAELQGRPETGRPASDEDLDERVSLRAALRDPAYRAALTASFGTGWVFFGVRTAVIPLFVVAALDRDPFWTGVGFAVVSGVQALTMLGAGTFVDVYGRRPAMIGGAALAAVSMGVLAASDSLALYLASMVLLGLGASALSVAPGAVVGDVTGGRSGIVVAAYQMARDFGTVVGPLVAGALAEQLSFGAAFAASAVIMTVVTVMSLAARETASARLPRRTRPSP
ncbi:MAG: MFS transporter [Carbonactinosporaceae bacterium]